MYLCTIIYQKAYTMQKEIVILDKQANESMSEADASPVNYYNADSLVINDFSELSRHMVTGSYFRSKQRRIMYVKKGRSTHNVNLEDHTVEEGWLMYTPVNSIFSISEVSPDFKPCVMSFDIPDARLDDDVLCFKLSPKNRKLVENYFLLSETVITTLENRQKALECIFASLLYSVEEIKSEQNVAATPKREPVARQIKRRFLRLLTNEGHVRHDIRYYAGKLGLTDNYLSILIKKESGLTVQEWCRMRTVTEARTRLSGTNDTLQKIADDLGFCNATQFGTFFKKHTGQTPMEYRNGKGIPKGEAGEKINS